MRISRKRSLLSMDKIRTASWIYCAIGSISKPCVESEIVSCADWIMHRIPSSEELRQSADFLVKNGLLEIQNDIYTLFSLGNRVYQSKSSKFRSVHKILDAIDDYLRTEI